MAHFIIGTAGHVDHGKTALVRALTGTDTDRLREEKERGMSIDIGFASLALPDGRQAGIVDVPGHERFVKNMLAGASGVDLALMVIAADDGVMPQTTEHLEIMELLGLKRGVIALTKVDLADPEWITLVKQDIRERLAGTFLADAPIVEVSSVTGQGLDELKAVLGQELAKIEARRVEGPFRLPIDRVFTVPGIGTVVTGTLVSGSIRLGDAVEVMPKGLKTRARHLQSHGRKVEETGAGMRTAVNLAGLEVPELERGDVLVPPGLFTATRMLDARLRLLAGAPKPLENRARVRFHLGTAEILARVVLLDRESLAPGDEAPAQLRLESPTIAARGDRFVIRSYSPQHTIGGGSIVAPNPPKHRRFDPKALAYLDAVEKGDPAENLDRVVLEAGSAGIPQARALEKSGLVGSQGADALAELVDQGRIRSHGGLLIHAATVSRLVQDLTERLDRYHRAKPASLGLPREELRRELAPKMPAAAFGGLVDDQVSQGNLASERGKLRLPGHQVRLTEKQAAEAKRIEEAYRKGGYAPPERSQAVPPGNRDAAEMFELLVDQGVLVRLEEDLYFHREAIERAEMALREAIRERGKITVAEFRDITGSSRKYVLPLLGYFDANRVTRRLGDDRVLY